jgi:hypothetical protein
VSNQWHELHAGSFAIRLGRSTPSLPQEPQHRNSLDFAELFGHQLRNTIRHRSRNASGDATQPCNRGKEQRRIWGEHLRRHSHSGLVRHPKPGQIVNMACVKKASVAQVIALALASSHGGRIYSFRRT